jgi:predicted Zn-dependent protease
MVQRSINLKVLIATVVIGAALAGTVHGVHTWQVGRTAKGLKVLAEQQEEKSEWLKAAQYLDRYQRLDSSDSEIPARLALLYTKGAKSPAEKNRAITLHFRALGAGESERTLEIRASLGDLLLEAGRYTDADAESRKLLADLFGSEAVDDEAAPADASQKPATPEQIAEYEPRARRVLALALAGQLADGSLVKVKLEDLKILSALIDARKLNPRDVRIAGALATLYREYPDVIKAEFPEPNSLSPTECNRRADATIDQLVADQPEDGKIRLARYLYRTKYNLPDAQVDLADAVRLAPDEPDVLLTAGSQALDEGRKLKADPAKSAEASAVLDMAEAHFQKLTSRPAEELIPAAFIGLGDVLLAKGDIDAALAAWQKGLKQFTVPTVRITLQSRVASTLLDANRLTEADESMADIEQMLKNLTTTVSRDYKKMVERELDLRKATRLIRGGKLAEAIRPLQAVIVSQPHGDPRIEATLQAWRLMGTVQMSLGEWMAAASAFDQVAALEPQLLQPRVVAANAYLMARRPELAAERAEQALAISDKSLDAWLTLASAQFQLQISLPVSSRDWRRFEQALAILEQARPQLTDGSPWKIDFLQVDFLMAKAKAAGNPADGLAASTALLRVSEERYADKKEFWLQLSLAYQSLGLPADADRALDKFKTLGAAPVESALAAARLATLRGDYSGAESILEAASVMASIPQRDVLRSELLRVARAARDTKKVRELLTGMLEMQRYNLALVKQLGELELEQRDLVAVEKWERIAAEQDDDKDGVKDFGPPGQTLSQYFRAWRLYLTSMGDNITAEKKVAGLKEALHALTEVDLARNNNWAEAATLKGMVSLQLGRVQDAASEFEKAIQLGDRRVVVYEQLIALLDQLGRTADIERYLSQFEAELPSTQRLAELGSFRELENDRPDRAVAIAREGVARRPSDPLAHLWLGRVLLRVNTTSAPEQLAEAEQAFRKALELDRADVRVWNGLLSFYTRTGDRAKSEEILKQLTADKAVDPAQKAFLLAQGYEQLGERESAQGHYQSAVENAPDNLGVLIKAAQFFLRSNPAEAEQHLRAALAIDSKSTAAQRLLAIALASQGGEKFEEAQTLLGKAGADGAVASEDLRLKALLLLQQGGAANLERAVQILESLVNGEEQASPSDRQLLAQLYERQAQLNDDPSQSAAKLAEARQQLELAAAGDAATPTSLASIVRFLIRRDLTAESLPWLDKLEAAVNRQAKPKGKDDVAADLLALVAQMQMQAKEYDRVTPWLTRLVKSEPNSLRPLVLEAQLTSEQKPEADLTALIEPRTAAILSAAADDAVKIRLMTSIGDLYSSLKVYPAAEKWYRQVVAAKPEQYPLLVGALVRQQKLADAIGLIENAVKTETTSRPALVLATALTESKPTPADMARAEPILTAALQEHEKDLGLKYAASLVKLIQGDYEAAEKLYREILAGNPKFVPALNNLAMLLAEKPTARGEALELISQAIEITGPDAGLQDTKGAILVYSQRAAEALSLLEAATRAPDADPRHHLHLALAYESLGQIEPARKHLQTAVDRQLESQLLMPLDRQLLAELQAALAR